MAINRNNRGRSAKKPPLPSYYISTGRSPSGLPKITPKPVPPKSEQSAPHSTRSTAPSRPKTPTRIYKAKLKPLNLLVVIGYSVLPVLTAIKLHPFVDWRYLLSGLLLIWIITWYLYTSDKKSAKSESRRIPENTLHFFELIGGWPAAYLAQQRLRHKTRKNSYKITFWLIGTLHQTLSFIYLTYPQTFANILQNAP